MAKYLFIESQDPLEDRGAEDYLGYAIDLAKRKLPVTVVFTENAVVAARSEAKLPVRQRLEEAGVTLRADELALRERGIGVEKLAASVRPFTAADVVDLLADPDVKALWH